MQFYNVYVKMLYQNIVKKRRNGGEGHGFREGNRRERAMKRTEKNGKIELLRFFFAMAIVLYHCQRHYLNIDKSYIHFAFFPRGYIGVEFFFLLTGFLMAKKIYKLNSTAVVGAAEVDLGLETVQFTWQKIKAILPWHLTSFAMVFAATAVLEKYSVQDTLKAFLASVPNLFLFNKTGFNFSNPNRVEWYITCMIFAGMILYPLCRKYYSMFVHVIAPVGGLFLLGYLTENFGTFCGASNWNGIVFTCMIRAVAEIALGTTVFEISRVLHEKQFSDSRRKLLTLLEIAGYLYVVLFILSTLDTRYEIYAVFAMMMAMALTFSGQVYGNEMFNNRLCYLLGKASLPIYLNQILSLDFVESYLPSYSGPVQTVCMVTLTFVNVAICAGIIWSVGCIRKRVRK